MNKKIFFTGDTHFGTERTLVLSRRPFANVDEMNKKIIKNWNSMVSDIDIVYHLGDFGEYSIIKKLKGNVVLILGNYEQDDIKNNWKGNFDGFRKYLLKIGFYDVIENGLKIKLHSNDNDLVLYLTHKPLDCCKYIFNLFGHIHKLCMVKDFGLNVGVDNFYFKLATQDDILFYINAIKNYYDNDVFCKAIDLKENI